MSQSPRSKPASTAAPMPFVPGVPTPTSSRFPPTSRYFGVAATQITTADGGSVTCLGRRFVPPADRFALLTEHVVVEGDRLDNLTAAYLGDPTQFLRVCDANEAHRPDELTETIGRRLRITLPEGIPGPRSECTLPLALAPGDVLFLEEVRGRASGLAVDADPTRQQQRRHQLRRRGRA